MLVRKALHSQLKNLYLSQNNDAFPSKATITNLYYLVSSEQCSFHHTKCFLFFSGIYLERTEKDSSKMTLLDRNPPHRRGRNSLAQTWAIKPCEQQWSKRVQQSARSPQQALPTSNTPLAPLELLKVWSHSGRE